MREDSVTPLTARLVEVAHELRHRHTFRIQREVRDALEDAGVEDELLLVVGQLEVTFYLRVAVPGDQHSLEKLGRDAQLRRLFLQEQLLLLTVLLEVKRVEHVLEHADGGGLARGGPADDHDTVARVQRLVNVVDVLDEVAASIQLPAVKPRVDHVHDVVLAAVLGDGDVWEDV